jgi:hypothetical protein
VRNEGPCSSVRSLTLPGAEKIDLEQACQFLLVNRQ